MGMTREEEIKGRIEKYGACYSSLSLEHPQAGDDLRYLLARNEELQRRVERMERVIGKARALSNTIGDPFVQHAMLHAALPRLIDNLQAELEGLDAANAEEK